LLFYNPSHPKPTPSGFVNLKKFATYELYVKSERIVLYIILLGNLYYFIELYVKIKIEM